MKKLLEKLHATGVVFRLCMTGEKSGQVFKVADNSLWFEFSTPGEGLKLLKELCV